MTQWLLVFAGGGLGSLARFAVGLFFVKKGAAFPFATLLANVAACFLFGAALAFFEKKSLSPDARLFLMTGFCGGFSTFSTFSGETLALFQSGQPFLAMTNITASFALCLLAVWLGVRMFAG